MNENMASPPRRRRRGEVIALHCSGAGAGQWNHLAEALGGEYEVLTPEHYGNESTGPWTGEHPFTLADEAARTIALIDTCESKLHLVGHSYGGGVALHVALARPERIASLALYEPSAFHLLRQMGGKAPRRSPKSPASRAALVKVSSPATIAEPLRLSSTTGTGPERGMRCGRQYSRR